MLLIEIEDSEGGRYHVNLLSTFEAMRGKTLTMIRLTLDGQEVCGFDFRQPVGDLSLHDMETGACKCEVHGELTNYGSCAVCLHGAHDSRKYCGALR